MPMAEPVRGAAVMMPIGDQICFANQRFPMPARYERWAVINHGQSLRKLASRGGLYWDEAAAIVQGRKWQDMAAAEAEQIVHAHLLAPRP